MTRPQQSARRWIIIALIAIASVLNYVDRQTLALLAKPVQRDLNIDEFGYANLVTFFLAAYTIGNLVTGWFVTRIGPRRGLALFVGWWSLASALGGVAQNALQLGLTRFALGLGEAGNWTAAPVLVRQWFRPDQRAIAIGIYTGAAQAGGTIAPPLIALLGTGLGWRAAFILTGVAGLVWVAAWLLLYRGKHVPPADDAVEDGAGTDGASWGELLRQPKLWALSVAWAVASPVWFFYLFWFPKYLTDERGLSLVELGRTAWAVYAAAGVGAVVGGFASGMLVKRGHSPAKARLLVMTFVAALAPIGAINALAPAIVTSLWLAAFVGFCHFLWTTNITALAVDLFPTRDLGKVLGLTGLLSGLAGIGTTYLIALLVGTLSYRPMFAVMACLYPFAAALAWITISRSQSRILA